MAIIKTELLEIKEKHATPRLTEIVPDEGEIAIEDLIANEGVIITITHSGLIKRTNVSSYRAQRRGGKGVIGMTTREGATPDEDKDFIEHLFTASTHDYLMFFTNTGRVYVERVHEIPDMGRAAKGRSIANLLELKADEKIAALIRVLSKTDAEQGGHHLAAAGVTVSSPRSRARSRKPSLEEFANVRKGGIIAIGIEPGDTLIDVKLTSGSIENERSGHVVLITKDGMSIRFPRRMCAPWAVPPAACAASPWKRPTPWSPLAVVVPDATLLVAGENGIGKRTPFRANTASNPAAARASSP